MHHFTSDIIQALVKKEDVSEIFRSHLEDAMNTLLKTELTAFLDYEKYDRSGFNSGNSRNGDYTRTLHTEYGDLELKIPRDRNGDFKQQTVTPYQRSNDTLELDEPLSETLDEDFEVVAENWIEDNREAVDSWIEGVDTVDGESFELVTTPWDEMQLISNITANVLEEQGYNIVLTPADPAVLFEAVANGEADATVAPLVPVTHGDLYAEYEGQFEDLGPTLLNMEIGLAVPQYMDIDSLDELEPNE